MVPGRGPAGRQRISDNLERSDAAFEAALDITEKNLGSNHANALALRSHRVRSQVGHSQSGPRLEAQEGREDAGAGIRGTRHARYVGGGWASIVSGGGKEAERTHSSRRASLLARARRCARSRRRTSRVIDGGRLFRPTHVVSNRDSSSEDSAIGLRTRSTRLEACSVLPCCWA